MQACRKDTAKSACRVPHRQQQLGIGPQELIFDLAAALDQAASEPVALDQFDG